MRMTAGVSAGRERLLVVLWTANTAERQHWQPVHYSPLWTWPGERRVHGACY